MTDWSVEIESRNYKIKRIVDRGHLLDLSGFILSILLIAGALFFHSWNCNRIRALGYELQHLQDQEEELIRLENNLILEEATLKDPALIDAIARNELGMSRLRPSQIIPARLNSIESAGDAELAMATSPQSAKPTRKLTSTN